jgi:hypothetical protein
MPERLRHQRDRCALVDRVAGVGVAEPMGGGRWIDAGALRRGLHDVVDAALGDREHAGLRSGAGAPRCQGRGDLRRQQDVAGLIALADNRELRLAPLGGDDLPPGEVGQLGDAQRAVIGDLQLQALWPGLAARISRVTSTSDSSRCASVRGAFLSLISGAALKRVKPTLCAKPRKDFTAAILVLTVTALALVPSALVRIVSSAVDVVDRGMPEIASDAREAGEEGPPDPLAARL